MQLFYLRFLTRHDFVLFTFFICSSVHHGYLRRCFIHWYIVAVVTICDGIWAVKLRCCVQSVDATADIRLMSREPCRTFWQLSLDRYPRLRFWSCFIMSCDSFWFYLYIVGLLLASLPAVSNSNPTVGREGGCWGEICLSCGWSKTTVLHVVRIWMVQKKRDLCA